MAVPAGCSFLGAGTFSNSAEAPLNSSNILAVSFQTMQAGLVIRDKAKSSAATQTLYVRTWPPSPKSTFLSPYRTQGSHFSQDTRRWPHLCLSSAPQHLSFISRALSSIYLQQCGKWLLIEEGLSGCFFRPRDPGLSPQQFHTVCGCFALGTYNLRTWVTAQW